jgi:hypothetical protein
MPTIEDHGARRVIKHGPFPRGTAIKGHRHFIDHDTFVHEGSTIEVEYRHRTSDLAFAVQIYSGPVRFLVRAGVYHLITAVSDGARWDCEFVNPNDPALPGEYHMPDERG